MANITFQTMAFFSNCNLRAKTKQDATCANCDQIHLKEQVPKYSVGHFVKKNYFLFQDIPPRILLHLSWAKCW